MTTTDHDKLGAKARIAATQALIAAHPDEFAQMLKGAQAELGFEPKRVVLSEAEREARTQAILAEREAKRIAKLDEKEAKLKAELAEIEAAKAGPTVETPEDFAASFDAAVNPFLSTVPDLEPTAAAGTRP